MTRRCTFYTQKDLEKIPEVRGLPPDTRRALAAVSSVLPFRVNDYVIENLIDWDRIPDDPMYQLTFPQPGMLDERNLEKMCQVIDAGDADQVKACARQIQLSLNPHPAGQMSDNVPEVEGQTVEGMQHKYRETVLFFPAQGQTCHAYCSYCFRWAQFVGIDALKFANRQAESLVNYLRAKPEVSNVLFTGGDPMIMRTRALRRYIEPLLSAGLDQLEAIRIGTKAPAYWPYRFTADGDADADDLLSLFEEVVQSGIHLAIMVHYSHPREMETEVAQRAIRRIRSTGAVVRSQAPIIRHVNDSMEVWREMWHQQLRMGVVPYYMFVERDTGPKNYFEVPLARALDIFVGAQSRISGLGRTARGPSMSAAPGKVLVDGVAEVAGEKVFVLKMIQARNPDWVGKTFFARYDDAATWIGDRAGRAGYDLLFRRVVETGPYPARAAHAID